MESAIRPWQGPIGSCALCEVPLAGFRGFADCDLGLGGVRGLVCPRCVEACHLRLGPGLGQFYRLDPWGRYVGIGDGAAAETPDLPGIDWHAWESGSPGTGGRGVSPTAPAEAVGDLLPGGFWSDPVRAGAHWQWLRDSDVSGASGPAAIVGWFGRFLGMNPGAEDLHRFMALGYCQGAELWIAQEPVRADIEAVADRALLNLAGGRRGRMGPGIGTGGLTVLRRWFRDVLFPERAPTGPVAAWATGVVLGHRAVDRGDLEAAILSAIMATAPTVSQFATRALLYRYVDPRVDFWTTFLLGCQSTDGIEGLALATALQSLRLRARRNGTPLRRFLSDVVRSGRELARSDPEAAGEIAAGRGEEDLAVLRRHHIGASGPLGCRARSARLFRGMRRHLSTGLAGMPDPDDVTSGMLLLRNAGEYLWWRGLLEGMEAREGGPRRK